jgi:hypothetical protein
MLNQVIRRAYYLNNHQKVPLLKEREEHQQYLSGKGGGRGRIYYFVASVIHTSR